MAVCQDSNSWVTIIVGTHERRIEFDPDIEMIYEELPAVLRCIAGAVAVRLMFAEGGFDLVFAPSDGQEQEVYRAESLLFDRSLDKGEIPLTPQADDAPLEVILSEWGDASRQHKCYATTEPGGHAATGVSRRVLAACSRRRRVEH